MLQGLDANETCATDSEIKHSLTIVRNMPCHIVIEMLKSMVNVLSGESESDQFENHI